ncbi:MAG: STAS domain-containing protein [Deltaproteobacteria bacterium]|nr:STAS domain-containing protein [Deltaproteobacteria bacterium]
MDNIVTDQRNGSRRLKLRGILSLSGAGELRDALIKEISENEHPEIDLGEVEEIDAGMLQLLCSAVKSAESEGKEIYWANISETCIEAAQSAAMFKDKWF